MNLDLEIRSQTALDKMQRKIMHAFKAAENQFQGIAFLIGGDSNGADQDILTMTSLFKNQLKFAEYYAISTSKADVIDLISSAAKFEYPIFCEYIVFYYSGHGGIEGSKPFLLPELENPREKVFIEEDIIQPFKVHNDMIQKKGGNERKYLFFFDCCLSSGENTSTASDSSIHDIQHFVNIDSSTTVAAYATAIGLGAQGQNYSGGAWTVHLSKHLNEDELSLNDVLRNSREAVMNEPPKEDDENYSPQIPFYVGESLAKTIYLKQKPSIWQTTSTSIDHESTEMKSQSNPPNKGGVAVSYQIKCVEWDRKFERAQMKKQIEKQLEKDELQTNQKCFQKFSVTNDGNSHECDLRVDIGESNRHIALQMKDTVMYDFKFQDGSVNKVMQTGTASHSETVKMDSINGDVLIQGILLVVNYKMKICQQRLFVLDRNKLSCHKTVQVTSKDSLESSIPIKNISHICPSNKSYNIPYLFEFIYFVDHPSSTRIMHLSAQTEEDMKSWIQAIEVMISSCNKNMPQGIDQDHDHDEPIASINDKQSATA